MAPADTILLQSILDRLSSLDDKVETIAERQAVIAERVDSHIASSEPKSGLVKSMDIIRGWILPIICGIFLLGRQSVEVANAKPSYDNPKQTTKCAVLDDTFVDKNRKLDALLMKQIFKKDAE